MDNEKDTGENRAAHETDPKAHKDTHDLEQAAADAMRDEAGMGDAPDADANPDDAEGMVDAGADVVALQNEVAELKDRILRERAEMENLRRRTEKEKADANAYGITKFARDMLSVVDNLGRAMQSVPESVPDDVKPLVDGVEMTQRELVNTLEKHGITQEVPEPGQKMDPNRHQAMFEVPTDEHPAGSVVQVMGVGYMIKDRLLRPAMVGVAKPQSGPQSGETKVDTKA